MDEATKQLKAAGNPQWKRLLVESFETSMADPGVSSKVQRYIVPQTDHCVALRGQMGLKTTQDCDLFAVGVYRSRTMSELPTYLEIERSVSHVLGHVKHMHAQGGLRVLGALAANCQNCMSCGLHLSSKPTPCWPVLSKATC